MRKELLSQFEELELFAENVEKAVEAARLKTQYPVDLRFYVGEGQYDIYKTPMNRDDIATLLSTPRELCKDCYNWCTQEDVGPNDFPQCGEGCHPETHNYLIGLSNTCPRHLVQ